MSKKNQTLGFRCSDELKNLIDRIVSNEDKDRSNWLLEKFLGTLINDGIELGRDFPENERFQKIKDNIALNHFKLQNLWLEPSGKFHPVPERGHCSYGEKLGCCPKSSVTCNLIDKKGWWKLSEGEWHHPKSNKASREQMEFIFTWCAWNNKTVPKVFNNAST